MKGNFSAITAVHRKCTVKGCNTTHRKQASYDSILINQILPNTALSFHSLNALQQAGMELKILTRRRWPYHHKEITSPYLLDNLFTTCLTGSPATCQSWSPLLTFLYSPRPAPLSTISLSAHLSTSTATLSSPITINGCRLYSFRRGWIRRQPWGLHSV